MTDSDFYVCPQHMGTGGYERCCNCGGWDEGNPNHDRKCTEATRKLGLNTVRMGKMEPAKMMMPPSSEMARMARQAVERDEWDLYTEFVTLHWRLTSEDGYSLQPGSVAIFAGDIDPGDYPRMMALMALKISKELIDDDHPCAYLLSIEGWSVPEPASDVSEEEKAKFEHDRRNHLFHTRDDRREVKTGMVASLDGRICMAHRYRDVEGVEEETYGFGDAKLGGRLPLALVTVARGMGAALGIPVANLSGYTKNPASSRLPGFRVYRLSYSGQVSVGRISVTVLSFTMSRHRSPSSPSSSRKPMNS